MKVTIKQHPGTGLWVSSDGRVILPPCPKYPKFRWTHGSPDGKGYLCIGFRGKKHKAHRLIAETFIPNPEGYKEVDHYPDRNPRNNRADNLRWAGRVMQNDNRQVCEDSKARYGVRECEDKEAYQKAYDAAYYAVHREEIKARNAAWKATQKALGIRYRRCPDGKRRWLSDSEFNARFSISQQPPLF